MITKEEYVTIHLTLADLAVKYLWNANRELSGEAILRVANRRARVDSLYKVLL